MPKTAAVARWTTSPGNKRLRKKTVTNDDKITTNNSEHFIEYSVRKNGYEGLIPEMILGITKKFSQLMFVVKWKNIVKPIVVEAPYMNINYPTMVIEYYESIIEWQNKERDEN